MSDQRCVVGVMTGTSVDAIDVVAAGVSGRGLGLTANAIHHHQASLDTLAPRLRAAAAQTPMNAEQWARLALDLGQACVEAVASCTAAAGVTADLIAVHGQTVFHGPPLSWQLINPAPLAFAFACPVVSDLRQADLAAGGGGAPITPLADWILFRADHRRLVLNLGGYCNATVLPADPDGSRVDEVRGFDVCACNQLLDAAARTVLGQPYDEDGDAAARGHADAAASEALRRRLVEQRRSGRSLGTGDEGGAWLREWCETLPPEDTCASVVHAVAAAIATAVAPYECKEAVLSGGGVMNRSLERALRAHLNTDVVPSDSLGVGVFEREALAMAVLGALAEDGVPITLPAVTGATSPAPMAGQWTLPVAGQLHQLTARR